MVNDFKRDDIVLCIKEEHEYHTNYEPTKGQVYKIISTNDHIPFNIIEIKHIDENKYFVTKQTSYRFETGYFCASCFVRLPDGIVTKAIKVLYGV